MSQPWGIDTGYDWEHPKCRTSFNNNDYGDLTPMAIYYSGQIVHISHPAKQHVADTCTNPFIPSQSMKLLMSSSPTVDTFDINVQMIGEDHKNGVIDHLGYQRCYNFCGDVDNAHCITSWRIPNVINPGRYSFIWLWEFNPNQFYSTCFDAIILISNNITNATITPSDSPIPTPASSTPISQTSTMPIIVTPEPSPTETSMPIIVTPEPSPTETPVPSSTKFPITSDATQLKSIIHELISSIRIAFNGTLIFSIFP
jgi:hypothetical protein